MQRHQVEVHNQYVLSSESQQQHQLWEFNKMREKLFRLLSKVPISVESQQLQQINTDTNAKYETNGSVSSKAPLIVKYYHESHLVELIDCHLRAAFASVKMRTCSMQHSTELPNNLSDQLLAGDNQKIDPSLKEQWSRQDVNQIIAPTTSSVISNSMAPPDYLPPSTSHQTIKSTYSSPYSSSCSITSSSSSSISSQPNCNYSLNQSAPSDLFVKNHWINNTFSIQQHQQPSNLNIFEPNNYQIHQQQEQQEQQPTAGYVNGVQEAPNDVSSVTCFDATKPSFVVVDSPSSQYMQPTTMSVARTQTNKYSVNSCNFTENSSLSDNHLTLTWPIQEGHPQHHQQNDKHQQQQYYVTNEQSFSTSHSTTNQVYQHQVLSCAQQHLAP